MMQRRTLKALRNIGFSATDSARALKVAGNSLSVFFRQPGTRPQRTPLEQVFAKLKTLLRKVNARTVETVVKAIGQILNEFTAEECAHYFANAGYGST